MFSAIKIQINSEITNFYLTFLIPNWRKNEGNENTVPPELANVEKVENGIEPAMYGAWRLLSVRDSLGNDESFDITGKIRLHISSTAVVIKSYYEKSEYKELSSK